MAKNTIPHMQSQLHAVMSYAAELELEVDRLRKRDEFLQEEAREHLRQTSNYCKQAGKSPSEDTSFKSVLKANEQFMALLRDMQVPTGYHPAFDQVVAIALQPLAEQVFRWQQRLYGATNAVLRLDLEPNYIHWFPARILHILENLISNSLRYRDTEKGEIRVGLQLRSVKGAYEFRFTDNGLGIADDKMKGMLELFYRAAPTRSAGLGVGLAVVKLLVEHSCGTLTVTSGEGVGTCVIVTLPQYNLDDYID